MTYNPLSLDSNKSIYRFLNYYDLYNILVNNRFRIRKLAALDDPNEGFGVSLISMLRPFFLNKNGLDNSEILNLHNTCYVSCWTPEKENIAMWFIYSPNKDCFRIKTTIGKLNNIFEKLSNYNNNTDKIQNYKPTTPYIYPMDYINFQELKKQLEKIDIKKTTTIEDALKKLRNNFEIFKKFPFSCKDENYHFENEIRASIHFNNHSSDEVKINFISNDLPNNFYIDIISDDFIEEITIDPRCVKYKKEIFEDFISNYNVSLNSSNIFNKI